MSTVGLVLDRYRWRVEPGKIAEFACAVRDGDPAYRHGDSPPVPVTFPASVMHVSRPFDEILAAVGVTPDRALHARQEYAFDRPLRGGLDLSAEVVHADEFTRTGRLGGALRFVVVRTTFTEPDGTVAGSSTATVVETSVDFAAQAAAQGLPWTNEPGVYVPYVPCPEDPFQPGHPHAGDLRSGDFGCPEVWGTISLTDIVRYAGASGDFTPFHHDPGAAAELGLDRIFAMGMLTASVLGRYASRWLGAGCVTSYGVRFHDKTWLGDSVRCEGRIVATDPSGVVTAELEAHDTTGRLLVSGTATALLPTPETCVNCLAAVPS